MNKKPRLSDLMAQIDGAMWVTPASTYPITQTSTARIQHSYMSTGIYPYWGIDSYVYYELKRKLPLTTLQLQEGARGWKTWMVDDPPQWRSMQKFAEAATGNVLVAGLGLGLVVHALDANINVKGVTIVERNTDVINLITPLLPHDRFNRRRFVVSDFMAFIHDAQDSQYDHIIVDIWVSSNRDDKQRITPIAAVTRYLLQEKFPEAAISLHGFPMFSDVKVVDKKVADWAIQHEAWGKE